MGLAAQPLMAMHIGAAEFQLTDGGGRQHGHLGCGYRGMQHWKRLRTHRVRQLTFNGLERHDVQNGFEHGR